MSGWVAIALSRDDAQKLYDHTGTMPFAPDSWTHRVRAELSSVLGQWEPDAQLPPGFKGINIVQEEPVTGGVPEPGGLPAAEPTHRPFKRQQPLTPEKRREVESELARRLNAIEEA